MHIGSAVVLVSNRFVYIHPHQSWKLQKLEPEHPGSMRDSNFKVFVRCRTKDPNSPQAYEVASSTDLVRKDIGKKYSFDRVFAAQPNQAAVFETCALPLVEEFLRGYNGTMFAYGQTGTGKTYTMTGDCESADSEAAGIVPRVLKSVFTKLEESQREEWSLELRYVELYNEELRDLLDPSPPTTKQRGAKQLRIGENQLTHSTEVFGATSHAVTSCESALSVIRGAQARRQTASTLLNSDSSRSHTVLTLVLVVREPVSGMAVRSKLHLVDLAGSESVAKSGAQRQRAVEAGEINKSLLALGRVIEALVDAEKATNGRPRYVSYRSSKLTQLLQDSLGGATKTSMVATVSIASKDADETRSTLDYALRARSIKNQQQTEVELLDTLPTIKEMSRRLEEVQYELTAQRTRDGCVCIPTARYEQLAAGEQRAAKVLAQHETATRHERAHLELMQRENSRLESQLAALMNEHRNCSTAAMTHTRFQQVVSTFSQASQKHATMATEICEILFTKLSELPSKLSESVSELRTVLESKALSDSQGLKDSCGEKVHQAFDTRSAECEAAISHFLQNAEKQLNEGLNKIMATWQASAQGLQRPLKDAATLTTHLASQMEYIQKRVAEEQAANAEAVALARDLMSREHKHAEILQQLQQASQDRQALTRRLIESGKASNTQLPQLSARTTSAGQCVANIEEILARPVPELQSHLAKSATEELTKATRQIPEMIVEKFGRLESDVTESIYKELALYDERVCGPEKQRIYGTSRNLNGLQQDISHTVSRHKGEVTGFTAKNASLQYDMTRLQQQVRSVPPSPQRVLKTRSPGRSPTRSPFRQIGLINSSGSPRKSNSADLGPGSRSRPGSGLSSDALASDCFSVKDSNMATALQDLGSQVNRRLRISETPKLAPFQQPSQQQAHPALNLGPQRPMRGPLAPPRALRRPPKRGLSPLQKRVKRELR